MSGLWGEAGGAEREEWGVLGERFATLKNKIDSSCFWKVSADGGGRETLQRAANITVNADNLDLLKDQWGESEETAKKIKYSEKEKSEFLIYNEIRSIRETGKNFKRIKEIIKLLKNEKSEAWLLFLEILELLKKGSREYTDVRNALISISKINSKEKHLIDRGLNVLDFE